MDYLKYYKLKEHPFSNVVDNKFYYNSVQHSDALTKLKYAMESKKGLAVVIGSGQERPHLQEDCLRNSTRNTLRQPCLW